MKGPLSVQVDWQSLGRAVIDGRNHVLFPKVEPVPGLYHLELDSGWHYYGKAKDLRRRFGNYKTGNTGLVQEHRLHHALREAVGADVFVAVGSYLADDKARSSMEKQAIKDAQLKGLRVLNGVDERDPYCLNLDIRFHENTLCKLKQKLALFRENEAAQ